MTPYYESGRIILYHGDCREILPRLPPADLIFTSPPYNLGNTTGGGFAKQLGGFAYQRGQYAEGTPASSRKGVGKWSGGALAYGYENFDDAMPHDKYVSLQNELIVAFWAGLSDAGAIFYNHKPRVLGGKVLLPIDYVPSALREFVRQEVIWARAGGVNFSPSFYCPTHERIIIIAKPDWRLRDKAASGAGDVWYIPQESGTEHPAPFPIGLPLRAMETIAPGLTVDPCSGSGTTLRAAKDMNRPAIGIEIEEKYCEIAAKRLSQEAFSF